HNLFRLAEQMGWIEEDEYCRIQLGLTHQEIAWMAGATRESVTIVMQDLAKSGRIRTGFKSVSLHRDEIANLRKITAHL
ncbi:winged helix-turn-helix domain-containing protein, partial [Clostridioides difficile]